MKLFDMREQHQHATRKAESILKTAEDAGREMTAAENNDFQMAMNAANALAPKIKESQSVNTMSQFFNREGKLLMNGGMASPGSRNQTPMSEEYTNAFVAFLRSGGKQASSALSEGFDSLFGGFALPSLPGVSATLYEGTGANGGFTATVPTWFRQLDLAPFDGLIWPHLEACDLLFRAGLGGRSP